MLLLLFVVLVCGVLAWIIQALEIPNPYKVIGQGILVIIMLIALFNALGVDTSSILRR